MSETSLEKRVAALEKTVAQLLAQLKSSTDGKDWRSAIGRSASDEVMNRIDREGQRIREQDRRKVQP